MVHFYPAIYCQKGSLWNVSRDYYWIQQEKHDLASAHTQKWQSNGDKETWILEKCPFSLFWENKKHQFFLNHNLRIRTMNTFLKTILWLNMYKWHTLLITMTIVMQVDRILLQIDKLSWTSIKNHFPHKRDHPKLLTESLAIISSLNMVHCDQILAKSLSTNYYRIIPCDIIPVLTPMS